jgi:hypothetical protein
MPNFTQIGQTVWISIRYEHIYIYIYFVLYILDYFFKNYYKITSRFLSVDCAAMEHLVVDVDGVTPLERRVSDVAHDAVEVVGSTVVDHLALLGALRHVSEFDNLDLFSQRFI